MNRRNELGFVPLWLVVLLAWGMVRAAIAQEAAASPSFADDHQPGGILARRCLRCHEGSEANGGLVLETRSGLLAGGDSGPAFDPQHPLASPLWMQISGDEPAMPQGGPALSRAELAVLEEWLKAGAPWPAGVVLAPRTERWWSWTPLEPVPLPSTRQDPWVRTPIDAFILERLRAAGLEPAPEAERHTLIRRLSYDLRGLPPTPAEVQAFVHDSEPRAYERLVDRLLDSPQYGERWARHWLDVVHYGDTHGYDKDKLRPNAWPYRDYVIRSLNDDKPYARFVREQLAGDALWPEDPQAIVATGFIAAGPWDFIGHAEVSETKIDGQVARNLDRDDMVTSTMNTFLSTTVQCARCHDHKFDPISQAQYYGLQAVFAALDRADREYDPDPEVARRRALLWRDIAAREAELDRILAPLEQQGQTAAAEALRQRAHGIVAPVQQTDAFGYHSEIAATADAHKWVQLDLGRSQELTRLVLRPCYDDFNGIGAGFGFPVRYRVEISDDPAFREDVSLVADRTHEPQASPGLAAVEFLFAPRRARYVRVTATELASRQNDFIFALAELEVGDASGNQLAPGAAVTAEDSIEAAPRWQRANLVDGQYPAQHPLRELPLEAIPAWLQANGVQPEPTAGTWQQLPSLLTTLRHLGDELAGLPAPQQVYAGTVHRGSGAFRGTGHDGGKPRVIRVLERGEVTRPGEIVPPGTLAVLPDQPWSFALPEDAPESARRIALADWIVRADNPLTWRSIVNRVWLHHFGRGLVASPNDFGRMGERPSHPELLDWLAVWFRDEGQSLKSLHRLMVTSSVYRQSSLADESLRTTDPDNQLWGRMARRPLDAESLRDGMLAVSGILRPKMYGPGFQDFVLERPEHSPHYEYHLFDPADPASHRRSIYRFLVRSQQQPFMQSLDCADPSQSIPQRDTTLTAIQALTMLNNRFVLFVAEQFAQRLETTYPEDVTRQLDAAVWETLGRPADEQERRLLEDYVRQFGLANGCRLLFNLNEFAYVD